MKAYMVWALIEVSAVIMAAAVDRPFEFVVMVAAAVAAFAYLWRTIFQPAIHAISRAAHVYDLLATEESGFIARLHRLEGGLDALRRTVDDLLRINKRLDRVEAIAEAARKAAGTRDEDHPSA